MLDVCLTEISTLCLCFVEDLCIIFLLLSENEKLREDLEKVEQLEDKINTELVMLREKISSMETELVTFRDLDSLKRKSEEKKQVYCI